MSQQLVHWNESQSRSLTPTTLTKLGKSEAFLEELIYDNFDLLGLENGQNGIRGPYRSWRQPTLHTPEGRTIYPDIVAIAASGHLIIVEVKLSTNDELKSRKVLSQIVDYASSFAAASRSELIEMFSPDDAAEVTWEEFVGGLFPESTQIQQVASLLEQRIRDGELNLIIACDQSPLGTRELLRGVAVQSALGFQLDLVEITPYVNADGDENDIVFVPHVAAATEIISRTAVTVTIEEGAVTPGVVVEATSLEEIEDRLAEGNQRRDQGRKWTTAEIEEVFLQHGSEVQMKLLDFCKEHSLDGRFSSGGLSKNAAFGLNVPIVQNGAKQSRMVFTAVLGRGLYFYIKRFRNQSWLGEEFTAQYWQKLTEAFQNEIDFTTKKEMSVAWAQVEKNYDQLCEVLLWLKETLEERCARDLGDE